MKITTITTKSPRDTHGRIIALGVGLLCTTAGCDEAARARTKQYDRQAMQAMMAAKQAELTPEELSDIVVESPSVRDIVDGRIDAPRMSRSFGLLDEDGEIVRACPQGQAALSGAPVEESRDIPFDTTDELLLATPLDETCLMIDRRTEDAILVRCADTEGAAEGGQYDIVNLAAGGSIDCYFCNWMPFCGGNWLAKKPGTIINGVCYAAGSGGCC